LLVGVIEYAVVLTDDLRNDGCEDARKGPFLRLGVLEIKVGE
jgi:hypothetical protein